MHHYLFTCLILACFIADAVGRVALLGGYEASAEDFSYQISLQIRGHRCGGGIIDDHNIVTAAHCVVDHHGYIELHEVMFIIAGTNDLRNYEHPAVRVHVTKIFVPREFKPSPGSPGDIAILRLATSLELSTNTHLKRLNLPKSDHEIYAGKKAQIAGFGLHYQLLHAAADVLNHNECQKGHKDIEISTKSFCARVRQKNSRPRGTCVGDSGGPLVLDGTVIGVLSAGPSHCNEKEIPGLYTSVTSYLKFVKHAINDENHEDIIFDTRFP